MPQNKSAKNDDKNYHALKKQLENQARKLARQLKSLQQRKKAGQSAHAIWAKDRKLTTKRVRNISDMGFWKAAYYRELFRRKNCKTPSNQCPLGFYNTYKLNSKHIK